MTQWIGVFSSQAWEFEKSDVPMHFFVTLALSGRTERAQGFPVVRLAPDTVRVISSKE